MARRSSRDDPPTLAEGLRAVHRALYAQLARRPADHARDALAKRLRALGPKIDALLGHHDPALLLSVHSELRGIARLVRATGPRAAGEGAPFLPTDGERDAARRGSRLGQSRTRRRRAARSLARERRGGSGRRGPGYG